MTVSAETPIQSSVANGVTTVFPYTFTVLDADDLVVTGTLSGILTTYILGVDYTLTGVGTGAGSVVFGAPPAATTIITRYRVSALTRETDYQDLGDFNADPLNLDFDRIWLAIQELFAGARGNPTSVRVPASESIPELPPAASRANMALVFDALGNPTVLAPASGSSADVLLLLADSTLAANGAGRIAYNALLTYGAGTVGAAIKSAATVAAGAASAASTAQTTADAANALAVANLPRDHIAGLALSPAGGSATMPIAAGQAANDANTVMITLASAINKTTAAWAAGNNQGGLDTGVIGGNSWYYFFLIRNPMTTVVDVLFSLSPTSPTMPSGFTQKRYIGASATLASQWQKVKQDGDDFYWDQPLQALSTAASGIVAVLQGLNVPNSIRTKAYLHVTPQALVYISDPSNADMAPSLTVPPLSTVVSNGAVGGGQVSVWTNTSGQIRYRCNVNGALYIATLGWMDRRGRA